MKKRGISIISLVIIIIVTIILIGIAVTSGYRYISEANSLKARTLGEVIGNSAGRRQNDLASGVVDRFYDGYYIDIDTLIANKNNIMYYPEGLVSNSGDLWYLVDAESATDLGNPGADDLLTKDISYFLNSGREQTLRVVLVNYITGEGYYITMPSSVAKLIMQYDTNSTCPLSPNGKHKFTIRTCTDVSICIYCKEEMTDPSGKPVGPLGHKWIAATCTSAGYCERCSVINPNDSQALGHLLISNSDIADENSELVASIHARNCYAHEDMLSGFAWISNADRHWHECKRCGIQQLGEENRYNNVDDTYEGDGRHYFKSLNSDKLFMQDDNQYHHQECQICHWTSIKSKHELVVENVGDFHSSSRHKVVCKLCDYNDEHNDSGWKPDHPDVHYRICLEDDNCNSKTITLNGSTIKVVFIEEHFDHDHDYKCDVCGRSQDNNPPLDFNLEDGDITTYARVKKVNGKDQITTCSIAIEAFTIDKETVVSYYQFGIYQDDGTINWLDKNNGGVVEANNNTTVASHLYEGLINNKAYTFYVRAFDTSGNANRPCPLTVVTANFPDFNGLKDVPNPFVKTKTIGVNDVETDLPGLKVTYNQNGGSWSSEVPLENISSIGINLTSEVETINLKFVDANRNESPVTTYTLKVVDATPPTASIEPKYGDNNEEEKMQHFAVITLKDLQTTTSSGKGSGFSPNTEVKYGWSTSKEIAPETLITYKTENVSDASEYSFEVSTPTGVQGTYYLWVMKGFKDAVGNAAREDVVSDMAFVIDDIIPEITNVKMFNANPVVPDENLFVKTDGTVTITFTANKELREDPTVKINDVKVDTISHDGLDYTCTIRITDSFEEGTLQLFIGDAIGKNGRTIARTINNDDLQLGPVIYDKTLPILEYIPKKDKNYISLINGGTANLYQISYDKNTTDAVSNMPVNQIKTQGVDLVLSEDTPKREGFKFRGWAVSKSATVANFQPGGLYKIDNDSTLYAVWDDRITLSFDGNGSDISMISSLAEKHVAVGTTVTIPTTNKTEIESPITLHSFAGWSTTKVEEEEDTEIVEYAPGDTITINEDTTLYAVYTYDLISSVANSPVLGDGMKAVWWTDENDPYNSEVISDTYPEGSYSYISKGHTVRDEKVSKWANAITEEDHSYWVWIPRFAYKIHYYGFFEGKGLQKLNAYEVPYEEGAYGQFEVLFMYGTSNTHYRDANGNPQPLPEGFNVHPAFQKMSDEDMVEGEYGALNPEGKWNCELEGIWVAKYEASPEYSEDGGNTWQYYGMEETKKSSFMNVKTTNAGNKSNKLLRVVSKPSRYSWKVIDGNQEFSNSENMFEGLSSHLIKNSEWGAVAYLSYSTYGRNGTNRIGSNQNLALVTGSGKGEGNKHATRWDISNMGLSDYTEPAETIDNTRYSWKGELGKEASSTGNIYGIYDLVGGAFDATAGYNININNTRALHRDEINNIMYSPKIHYKQRYPQDISNLDNNAASNNERYRLLVNIKGDGIYETLKRNFANLDSPINAYGPSSIFRESGVFSRGGPANSLFSTANDVLDYVGGQGQWGTHDLVSNYNGTETYRVALAFGKTYEINYESSISSGSVGNMPSSAIKTGGSKFIISNNVPSLTNYVFCGWESSNKYDRKIYQPGDEYIINADTTFTAIWRSQSSITFDANNIEFGEGTFSNDLSKNLVSYKSSKSLVTKYSHTPNMGDDGVAFECYENGLDTNEVVTIPGASSLHVKIYYRTSGFSGHYDDYLCIWNGVHYDYRASKDYSYGLLSSHTNANGKIGGEAASQPASYIINEIETDIDGDSVTFGFYSSEDGPFKKYKAGYGYYAVVTANGYDTAGGEYEEPALENHSFVGWADSNNAKLPTYVTEADVRSSKQNGDTLYAVYGYNVEYDYNGGSSQVGVIIDNNYYLIVKSQDFVIKYKDVDIQITDVVPSRSGYTFMGWDANPNADPNAPTYTRSSIYTDNAPIKLYAIWKPIPITIYYNANSAIDEVSNMPETQSSVANIDTVLSEKVPVRAGYTFVGWANSNLSTVPNYMPSDTIKSSTNITLYAIWAHVVTYDSNGGSTFIEPQYKIEMRDLILNESTPTKEGFTFAGWGLTSTSTEIAYYPKDKYILDEDITLYAIYGNTVTFEANGGSMNATKKYAAKIQGIDLVLPSYIPTRTNYAFIGWGLTKNDTVPTYQAGDIYSRDEAITLYALWEPKAYTITYVTSAILANGTTQSSLTTIPVTYKSQTSPAYITTTIPQSPITMHSFIGWSTTQYVEGIGTEIAQYAPGDEYNINEDITLYAVYASDLIESKANAPKLGSGMKAVYWTNENNPLNSEVIADNYPSGVYDYNIEGHDIRDAKTSKWANAITEEDGSYWVWIPRYAYRIRSFTSSSFRTYDKESYGHTDNSLGQIEVLFMYGTSDTKYRDANGNPQDLPEGYIVHPAFQKMTTTKDLATNPLGKWDEELEGIWVSKFEISQEKSTDGGLTWKNEKLETQNVGNVLTTNAGNTSEEIIRAVSKPSKYIWRNCGIDKAYLNSLNINIRLNSHMMKNSEWGAVAYLTYSAYGRNGSSTAVNQNSQLVTGSGKGTGSDPIYGSTYSVAAESINSSDYAWYKELGTLTSSTGNIYGIYDLSGGNNENVASYINSNGSQPTSLEKENNLRYKQIYEISSQNNALSNYALSRNVYGDAIWEVTRNTSSSPTIWNKNCSISYPYNTNYLFRRGAYCSSSSIEYYAGIFITGATYPSPYSTSNYHAVLTVGNNATIRYDTNAGNDEVSNVPSDQSYQIGENITISNAEPVREGYSFMGWSSVSSSTEAEYAPGDSLLLTESKVLYAVWKSNWITINYVATNGGRLGTIPASVSVVSGRPYTIPSDVLDSPLSMHSFVGWTRIEENSLENDEAEIAEFLPGETFTPIVDTTLYSVFKSDLISSVANAPVLAEGMKAVYWTDESDPLNSEVVADSYPEGSYNYVSKGHDVRDEKTSKWANAITEEDGSYWVWIPRYAYKIHKFNSTADGSKKLYSAETTNHSNNYYGQVEVLFLNGVSNQYLGTDGELHDLPEGYIIHPAFQKMTTPEDLASNPLGKWDNELEGIWVAKYEISREDSDDGGNTWTNFAQRNSYDASKTDMLTTKAGNNNSTIIRAVSKPNMYTWTYISNYNIYKNLKTMHPGLNSHEIKNSEWGAVSYLAVSAYGRNGFEIAVNNNSNYVTGSGKGEGSNLVEGSSYYLTPDEISSTKFAWYGENGKMTSTTGNIYGIYDMSSKVSEYTASYLNNGSANNYNTELFEEKELKYKQVYSSTVSDGTNAKGADYELLNTNKIVGDAVYETSRIYDSRYSGAWNSDCANMPSSSSILFVRGGTSFYTGGYGVFGFDAYNGNYYIDITSRPVLAFGGEYTITYNANGDSVYGLPSAQVKQDGFSINLSDLVPQRNNYTFNGWTDIEGGTISKYQPGDAFIENKNITLYAVWMPNEHVTYSAENTVFGNGMFSNGRTENYVSFDSNPSDITKYSHTANIDDTGYASRGYRVSDSKTEVVKIPGATSLHVKLYVSTYNSWGDCDWACVWQGNHPDYLAEKNFLNSALGATTEKFMRRQ